jgi:hypothetical protein
MAVCNLHEALSIFMTTPLEWVAVPALSTVQNVVCRTSNRLFLGEPICESSSLVQVA